MDAKIIILSLLCCLAEQAAGQQPFFRQHDLSEVYGHTLIRSLYRAEKDFLWLGTETGLMFYDGHNFEPVARPDSLGDAPVTSMYRDGQGIFWVGYEDGALFQYDIFNQLQAWRPEAGWPGAPVTAFAEDGSGNLWMATYGEGLYYRTGNRLSRFSTDDGLSGQEVYTIQGDQRGRIWAATDNGISICWLEDGVKKVKNIGRKEGLPDEIVRVIEADDQGDMWVGTYEHGFGMVSAAEEQIKFWISGWDHGVITAMEMVSPSEIWLGTEKSGIWRYDLADQRLTTLPGDRFRKARVNDLHRDAEGNIWILNNSSELLSGSLLFEIMEPGMENVQAILVDRKGRLWAGTQDGLYLRVRRSPAPDTFLLQKHGNFLSLFEDRYHNIWAGTFGQGVYIFQPDGTSRRQLSEADGLSNGSILSIDGLGEKVWLATLGGVTEMANHRDPLLPGVLRFRNYRHEDGLGTNFIYKVFVDSRRQVWFATDGEGLSRLKDDEFQHITMADSLPIRTVYTITEAGDGNIWFSVPQEGVFHFDGQRANKFSLLKRFREMEIIGMVTDGNGQILLIHPAGIELFNPKEERLIHYGKEVGIGNIEPNLNACFQDKAGNVWIGTRTGMIRYSGALPIRQTAPATQLRGVLVGLQSIDFRREQKFPHHRNNLEFDFSGLWYSDPESVRYRYKLEGFNPDWIVTRDQRVVYPQLPPGEYTFRLSASENDIYYPEPQVVYSFRIDPPFWQTPWFAVGLSVLLAAGVYYFVRSREKRLERQSILRREKLVHQFELLKSQINPHFLFNNFNTLVTLIEEHPPAAVAYVERLSDFYRNILQYRESPLIRLDEELELLRNYDSLLKERFADKLEISIAEALPSGYIIPLTLQLLVENAIKHNTISRESPLRINISDQGEGFIVVKNNLQLKWKSEPSTGFGLDSITKRYAMLTNKKVRVEKDLGNFSVSIPLLKRADML